MELTQYHEAITVLIARIFLGLLFFFQGFDALFKVKVSNIILAYEEEFSKRGIPRSLTVVGAWFTSIAEFVGGAFLVLGLFQYFSLYLIGINLIIASIGFGIVSPMWDMRYVFPRLALLLFLLVLPPSWNVFSLDHLLITLTK